MSLPSLLRTAQGADSPPVATSPRLLIVATDWDKELRGAAYVIERSRRSGPLRVDVLYASAPIIAWRMLRFWAYARVISWQREQGERLLRAYRDRLNEAGIAPTCHLRLDEPKKVITRLATEIGAECVVLSTPPTQLPPFGYWWELHKIIRQSGLPIVLA
jgi:nucleotide-binding universal stress UspA family protein